MNLAILTIRLRLLCENARVLRLRRLSFCGSSRVERPGLQTFVGVVTSLRLLSESVCVRITLQRIKLKEVNADEDTGQAPEV